jgi:hypothetical protein
MKTSAVRAPSELQLMNERFVVAFVRLQSSRSSAGSTESSMQVTLNEPSA